MGVAAEEIDGDMAEVEAEASSSSEQDEDSEEEDKASDEESLESSPEPEARILPKRATRGNKMTAVMEEEDEADQEFWGQDFFAEEERDTDWESSGDEVKDTVDSDFDKSEDEGDDEEGKDEPRERRSKALVAPGTETRRKQQQAAAAPKQRQPANKAHISEAGQPAARPPAKASAVGVVQAPQLRASTRARVEVAVKERDRQEQVAKKRPKQASATEFKPLTQEELLAEAAKTELDNERSLQSILAREEEFKKRQTVSTAKFEGVSVRYRSRTVVSGTEKSEQTRLEVLHSSELPLYLRPRAAPAHVQPAVCCVTGLPAAYRYPQTGAPFATAAAYAELQSNGGFPYHTGGKRRKRSENFATSANGGTPLLSSEWQGNENLELC